MEIKMLLKKPVILSKCSSECKFKRSELVYVMLLDKKIPEPSLQLKKNMRTFFISEINPAVDKVT